MLNIALAIAVVIALFPWASAATQPLTAADRLHTLGLFNGVGEHADGTPDYALDRTPTRHEAVVMLVRLLGKEPEALAGQWTVPFTDVDEWAAPYVGYAYANGLTTGTGAATFGGRETISATQYLTFVLRALGYESGTDFQWDSAWTLSDRLGITAGEYSQGAKAFLRGDVASISFDAMSATDIKAGKALYETLLDKKVITEAAVNSVGLTKTAVTGLTMDQKDLGLTVGEKATLTATTAPAGQPVSWSTSNAGVATVSNGTVSAVAKGTATITATAGGISATCTVTVKEPQTSVRTQIHTDQYVDIYFERCEIDSLFREEVLVFGVKNKTGVTLTFQSDSMSINGRSLGYVSGSDDVAPGSTGEVRFRTKDAFPTMTPTTLSGLIKVIDFSKTIFAKNAQSYKVSFTNVIVGTGELPETDISSNTKVCTDQYVDIYFERCEIDSLFREEVLVFSVKNKTEVTLTFQSDALAIDGQSLGYVSGSDDVAPNSIGEIAFRTKSDFPTMTPSTLSGSIKVIDFSKTIFGKNVQSYTFTFANVTVGVGIPGSGSCTSTLDKTASGGSTSSSTDDTGSGSSGSTEDTGGSGSGPSGGTVIPSHITTYSSDPLVPDFSVIAGTGSASRKVNPNYADSYSYSYIGSGVDQWVSAYHDALSECGYVPQFENKITWYNANEHILVTVTSVSNGVIIRIDYNFVSSLS